MVRRVVMEMVEDATVPWAIWTLGKGVVTGKWDSWKHIRR